ncbi:dimer_Tnp_hAT domain-containing protein [Haematococcus lacustris]|uniref:Dimer_Tnp_hAT domain-containing protein n=1 Tax=Haematococcus lacustris TaxID=44745 RepID=A0A699YRL7_HAELA|nr:dimer_Tnp_hAT domain-containing protein [Haematococcus lacustris]
MELEQVFRKRMDYGHHVTLFLAALLDARYGSKLPHLQVVAQRVLNIPATSAATERLFSAFKFIWSDRRS